MNSKEVNVENIDGVFNEIKKIIENRIDDINCIDANEEELKKIDKVCRKQLIKKSGSELYKFAEYTKFNENTGFCVAIGFNPAKCNIKEYDNTNKKLCSYFLKKEYGGYILLNLYPIVSKNEDSFHCDDLSMTFYDEIIPCLIDSVKCNIYVFWGSTIGVSEEIGKALEKNSGRVFFITDQNGHHHHPAYVKEENISEIKYNYVTIEKKGYRYK